MNQGPNREASPEYPGAGGARLNPLAIASMVLGMVTLPGCCCWVASMPLAVAGIVTAIVALQRIRDNREMWRGQGLAVTAIVFCVVGMLLSLLVWLTPWGEAARPLVGRRV